MSLGFLLEQLEQVQRKMLGLTAVVRPVEGRLSTLAPCSLAPCLTEGAAVDA